MTTQPSHDDTATTRITQTPELPSARLGAGTVVLLGVVSVFLLGSIAAGGWAWYAFSDTGQNSSAKRDREDRDTERDAAEGLRRAAAATQAADARTGSAASATGTPDMAGQDPTNVLVAGLGGGTVQADGQTQVPRQGGSDAGVADDPKPSVIEPAQREKANPNREDTPVGMTAEQQEAFTASVRSRVESVVMDWTTAMQHREEIALSLMPSRDQAAARGQETALYDELIEDQRRAARIKRQRVLTTLPTMVRDRRAEPEQMRALLERFAGQYERAGSARNARFTQRLSDMLFDLPEKENEAKDQRAFEQFWDESMVPGI